MVNPALRALAQTWIVSRRVARVAIMDITEIARMLAALGVTLGIIGLVAVAARRYGPTALLRLRTPAERRLKVVESLMLDPQRRLVLIRCDDEEQLILLGEGRLLTAGPAKGKIGASS